MPLVYQPDEASARAAAYGIVVSRYNEAITERLLQGALAELSALGVDDSRVAVAQVPGAWELPLAADELAALGEYDALICLGAVIKGETTHDEHINRQVSESLGRISLENSLPVAFGLLTCHTPDQALQRAGGTHGNKGAECAAAAFHMVALLASVRDGE